MRGCLLCPSRWRCGCPPARRVLKNSQERGYRVPEAPCQGIWGVSPQIEKTRPRAVAEGGVRPACREAGVAEASRGFFSSLLGRPAALVTAAQTV